MLASAALATALTPSQTASRQNQLQRLDDAIPSHFGQWHEIAQLGGPQVGLTPETGETLAQTIYDQSLLRTYQGPNGQIVMLAVAYGARQNDDLKVHRPEVCYVSQGFQILQSGLGTFKLGQGSIPITRLVARNGERYEPVTYWIRIGDEVVHGGFRLKLAIIKAGLLGSIPDGMLVRASTIVPQNSGYEEAFRTQDAFLHELLAATNASTRSMLIGKPALADRPRL